MKLKIKDLPFWDRVAIKVLGWFIKRPKYEKKEVKNI